MVTITNYRWTTARKIPEFGQQTPLKRAGQPVELAGTYVLLASEDASYITGQVFGVTGGIQIN